MEGPGRSPKIMERSGFCSSEATLSRRIRLNWDAFTAKPELLVWGMTPESSLLKTKLTQLILEPQMSGTCRLFQGPVKGKFFQKLKDGHFALRDPPLSTTLRCFMTWETTPQLLVSFIDDL